MPDKGKIMSQTYYDRQNNLIELYKEAVMRREMSSSETVTALRMIGFSETIAANKVRKWEKLLNINMPKIDRSLKQRRRKQASLEKYLLRMSLGKKYYDEYMKLQKK